MTPTSLKINLKIIQPEVAHGDDSNGIDLAEPPLPWMQHLGPCWDQRNFIENFL
jgi:hypothetical protein